MNLTEQIQVKPSKELLEICEKAKKLYNLANYLYRQRYFFRLKQRRYNENFIRKTKIKILKKHRKNFTSLEKYYKEFKKFKNSYINKLNISTNRQNYYDSIKLLNYYDLIILTKFTDEFESLPNNSAQQILKLLIKDWKSYWVSPKIDKKIPRYKKNQSQISFTYVQCRIKEDGYLYFPKKGRKKSNQCWIQPIKTRLSNSIKYKKREEWNEIKTKIKQVRIIPKQNRYIIEIVYEKKEKDLKLNKNNLLGIDIGIRNIITAVPIVNDKILLPFLIKGNTLKSINQFYNKKLAGFKSIAKKLNDRNITKKISVISRIRNNKINTIMHQISKFVVNYCKNNDIGTIIIGYNKSWKQNINLGKKFNQKFVQIPLKKIIDKISYKAELFGIDVQIITEEYTSKCSFLDNEEICKHRKYKGKRSIPLKKIDPNFKGYKKNKKCYGLFLTEKGYIINSDINGALNIIKKAVPNAFERTEIEVSGLTPRVIRFFRTSN